MSRGKTALIQHLREIWPDILTLAIFGGITLGVRVAFRSLVLASMGDTEF
jgi:uncharacterized membrane-anchored protein YitT (DUF2179 family)